MSKPQNITILSSCPDPWGGSEELWALSIPALQESGFQVTLIKEQIHHDHHRIKELQKNGVLLHQLHSSSKNRRLQLLHEGYYKIGKPGLKPVHSRFDRYLARNRPDLAVVAQGSNFDGLRYAWLCLQRKVPYVIICQKAVDFHWPQRHQRNFMEEAFRGAVSCLFVCKENLKLTEEQFGFRLTNTLIIPNPLRIEPRLQPYPGTSNGIKLACVGRLFVTDKGQDMLFRVLSAPKWKNRNLSISIFGGGRDHEGLTRMAQLLDLTQVFFRGFTMEISDVWRDHHALVLPSRNEGLPLTVLEAMAYGRPVIATRAGGIPSIVKDGETGFLGDTSEKGIDKALERAWNRRDEWESIGRQAFRTILDRVNRQLPEDELSALLTKICHEQ